MDIAMLETGQLMGRFRPIHLGQLTADLTSLYQSTAEKKKLKLEFKAPDSEGNTPQTYVDIRACVSLLQFMQLSKSLFSELWEKIFCNL